MEPNHIYCGKANEVLRQFPGESVDLIYADPPFFTQKNYEIIWGDGYEIRAYEDRWKAGGGAGGVENYIAWLEPTMRECQRVLKSTGSIYLHCDWHANAHLRVLMDRVFGESNFRNEIVWHYRGRGMRAKMFQRKHDTILVFGKTDKASFYPDEVLVPYDPKHVSRYNKVDSQGQRYALIKKRGGKHTRVYLKEGIVPDDVWDIPFVHGSEAVGYPTQKPEALLERIIKASSKPTDLVVDPFCGCGTAIAVAQKLGRRWIGIDISPTACKLMRDRMTRIIPAGEADFEHMIIGLPMTEEELKALPPFEFQNWVIQRLGGRVAERKVGDYGIDGYDLGGFPVQVKQSEHVGRNVVDNFETAMRRFKKDRGTIVALSFGRGAYGEVARAKNQEGLEIELLTLKELIERP